MVTIHAEIKIQLLLNINIKYWDLIDKQHTFVFCSVFFPFND
jgi:hypothetical protein